MFSSVHRLMFNNQLKQFALATIYNLTHHFPNKQEIKCINHYMIPSVERRLAVTKLPCIAILQANWKSFNMKKLHAIAE